MKLDILKNELQELVEEAITEAKKASAFIAPVHNKMVMLMKRTKDGSWGLPGGRMDKKEGAKDAAERETHEETNMKFKRVDKFSKFKGRNKNIHFYTSKAKNAVKKMKLDKAEHRDSGFFRVVDLQSFMDKSVNTIAVRNKSGKKVKVLTRGEFKLHKPAKILVKSAEV